jgi:polyisoprenoid-binding protein YceI
MISLIFCCAILPIQQILFLKSNFFLKIKTKMNITCLYIHINQNLNLKTMKNYLFLGAIALVFAACNNKGASTEAGEAGDAAEVTAESVTYSVDAAASSVEWKGSKITGDSHGGTISITDGSISVEGGAITAGNFSIDMSTITSTDGMNEEMTGKLMGHLRSADFFAVDSFPAANFEVTSGTADELTGNLTIKGITKEISFPYTLMEAEGSATATATFSIDRAEWDVRYGSGKFFEDLGDNLINDAVEIAVSLAAKS